MSEIKETDENKQEPLSRPRRLELKKTVETGQVRQSFAHGRSKMVTVEVRKKKTYARDERGRMSEVRREAEAAAKKSAEAAAFSVQSDGVPREGAAIGLTHKEKEARARALQDAIKMEEERAVEPEELESGVRSIGKQSPDEVETPADEAANPRGLIRRWRRKKPPTMCPPKPPSRIADVQPTAVPEI